MKCAYKSRSTFDIGKYIKTRLIKGEEPRIDPLDLTKAIGEIKSKNITGVLYNKGIPINLIKW